MSILPLPLTAYLPLAIGMGALALLTVRAQSPGGDYIHAEVQGLFSKSSKPGGEGTRFQTEADGVRWEVDVPPDAVLLQRAGELAGTAALVTGSLVQHRDDSRVRPVLVARSIKPVPPGATGEHIDVTVRGTLSAGVMAIGGETTGVTITAAGVRWDLALQTAQRDTAGELNGSTVVVSGRLRRAAGVEIKDRLILQVRSLEPAPR